MGETIEQLRDQLAGLMGWTKDPTFDQPRSPAWSHPDYGLSRDDQDNNTHPVTLSLDWLAAHGLPDGWFWWLVDFYENRVEVTINGNCDGDILTCLAPTELHARLAACVAAWKAQAERSGT